ncbi:MAG TPA: TetR/AcrR family transcriptional regulator [Solirubrobacterales bacterium]|jgi:AcrR family transcriptional regulator
MPDRTNNKGSRTRASILDQAARLATVEGLDRLSIGQLAGATGLSKSGLYAHFGSKEQLQLATIERAREIFLEEVVRPALATRRGSRRLIALCDAFLSHVERKVFPGGCFFSAASVEVGSRKGRVHDVIARNQAEWLALLERLVSEAQESGELARDIDRPQLAFELHALVVGANNAFILSGNSKVLEQARRGVRERVDRAAAAAAA